jgi:hypothetical protein
MARDCVFSRPFSNEGKRGKKKKRKETKEKKEQENMTFIQERTSLIETKSTFSVLGRVLAPGQLSGLRFDFPSKISGLIYHTIKGVLGPHKEKYQG